MKPEKVLKLTTEYLKNLKEASTRYVAVGLPRENVGSEVYGSGKTILEVGASHEYGAGVPMRSFLRMPFDMENKKITAEIGKQFKKVFEENRSIEKALGLIGITARNIVLMAFKTSGFGNWKDITQTTKELKGSSKILIDSGTLRNSITWVVR